jgi:molybdenum cofactor cytidylyltransferase
VIAALLLAAGLGRRFGGPKLTQELRGKPLVRWSADALRTALGAANPLVVVVPPAPRSHDIELALAGLAARFVVNPDPEAGMGASLACGIAALEESVEAALIALGDEPALSPAWVERVVARYREGGVAIVAPTFQGVRGHPVLFARGVFPELRPLGGDAGARQVVDRDAARVAVVELGEPKTADVDTAEDLARLRQSAQYSTPPQPRHP